MVPTPGVKVIPPVAAPSHLPRPSLEARLDEGLAGRVTVVTAGAGFGKTALLASWSAGARAAWYSADAQDATLAVLARGLVDALRLHCPGIGGDLAATLAGSQGPDADERTRAEAFAASLCQVLEREVQDDLVLTLDDLHEMGSEGPAPRVVESMCLQAPPSVHLVLSSRERLPFSLERMRGRGQVTDLDAAMLAFSVDEVSALHQAMLEDGADLAGELHGLTGGWPAAVRMAIEALRGIPIPDRKASVRALSRPGMPLYDYLAEEVFAREGPEVRELVRRAALFDRFSADLFLALGLERADEILAGLARRGLFFSGRAEVDGWYSLTALIRSFAEEHLPVPQQEAAGLRRAAAAWFGERDMHEEQARILLASADEGGLADLLRRHGGSLLASGAVTTVSQAAARVPPALRDRQIDLLDGEAHQIQGDWEGALERFQRAAGRAEALPSGLAWRMGVLHHLRGELDQALAEYSRGRVDGSSLSDDAVLLAWTATAHWLRGEAKECRSFAERAMAAATEAADPSAQAVAHTVMAMVAALEGDRAANDAHYLRALDAAERAGDSLQILRIRVNRASRFNEEGLHAEALKELDIAIPLAELTGFAAFLALAINNRAEARFRLGRLDEALADFQAARDEYQRLGSLSVAYPLAGMGGIYRQRGDAALARATYAEAVDLAERAGDAQGLVPALSGLARVMAADDPEQAATLAARAREVGFGMAAVEATLTEGWVALARDDQQAAVRAAGEAADLAGERRDRAGLAESLVLRALALPADARAGEWADEAVSIWRDIGNPLAEAEALLVRARLSGSAGRAQVLQAQERLSRLGVRMRPHTPAGPLAFAGAGEPPAVEIQALGGFRVLRRGVHVPHAEWQSKKARDLLKILVSRRGVPSPRDVLMEGLWPEDDPEKVANRLSVALTTVRGVLDPDRAFPPEHFVAGDKEAVRLDLEHVSVDVERFLADAGSGLKLLKAGRAEDALPLLSTAQAAYAGEYLEEDLYEEWAVPLREQARATYISTCRALAGQARSRGEVDAEVRYHLSILERDAYDEEAHLGLVRALSTAGRHGEARRRYRMYVGRMEELGVEAHPFPAD